MRRQHHRKSCGRMLPSSVLPSLVLGALACDAAATVPPARPPEAMAHEVPAPAAEDVSETRATPSAPITAPAQAEPEPPQTPEGWGDEERRLLSAWYEEIGTRRDDESFGKLILRIARSRLGTPYVDPPHETGEERLRVRLETFQCVSFVESSIALARCIWTGKTDETCFFREVQNFRYRDGKIDGYPSRLHYFADWLGENARHGRFEPKTVDLGGQPTDFTFSYMTRHPKKYPALADPEILAAVREEEQRLSAETRVFIPREDIARIHPQLEDGDLVAIVGDKPGLFIKHAGFIDRAPNGKPRLLHASSTHGRVLLIRRSIGAYVTGWPDRRGIVVVRPLPPPLPAATAEPLGATTASAADSP